MAIRPRKLNKGGPGHLLGGVEFSAGGIARWPAEPDRSLRHVLVVWIQSSLIPPYQFEGPLLAK